jgi:quercetin dioxygenase-like cupin family protein
MPHDACDGRRDPSSFAAMPVRSPRSPDTRSPIVAALVSFATLPLGCSDAANAPPPATSVATAPTSAVSAGPEVKAKTFTVKLVGGEARVGVEDAVEISVVPASGYHVNEEYPYKFRLDAPPGDVTYPKDVVTEVTRTPELATMKIPFVASKEGKVRVSGTCNVSVCNADQCIIEKVPLATDVTVVAGGPAAPKPAQALPTVGALTLPGATEMTVPDNVDSAFFPEGASLGAEAFVAKPWLARFAKGASTGYPAAEVEIQGVVLDGSVQLRDDTKGGAAPQRLDAWTAFRAPGAAITLATLGDAPARVVLFVVSPEKKPLAKLLPDAKAPPGRRPAPANAARTSPIEVVDLQARSTYRWGKGTFEARVAWTTAGVPAALDAVVFSPGAAIAEHVHEGAWECLFPIRAAGDVIVDGKPQKVSPGVATCIAPDVKHAWKPAGTEPLVAVQFYAPAGAEQRFKTLAEKDATTPALGPATSGTPATSAAPR